MRPTVDTSGSCKNVDAQHVLGRLETPLSAPQAERPPNPPQNPEIIGKRLMEGQNVSCDFGGGKRTIECALQNQF